MSKLLSVYRQVIVLCSLAFLFIFSCLNGAGYFNSAASDFEIAAEDKVDTSGEEAEEPVPSDELSIIENVARTEDLSTLYNALQAADLVNILKGSGPFTLFAPTNEAFDKLPPGTLQNLLKSENKTKLAAILTYHILPGRKVLASFKTGKLKTLNGKELDIKVEGNSITINTAKITQPEIIGMNGTIYIVDSVILPN